jgi:hypothetical protein
LRVARWAAGEGGGRGAGIGPGVMQCLLGEQPLVPIVSSLLFGRDLLRRRWSGCIIFDLLVRVAVVVVELRRLPHAPPPEVPVLRDVDTVLVARVDARS